MSKTTKKDKIILAICICIIIPYAIYDYFNPVIYTENVYAYELANFSQKHDDTNIQCHLNVEHTGKVIIAELTFVNNSKNIVRVHKWALIENGEMTSSEFEVTRDSIESDYHCMTIKRGPPAEADMRSLQPGVPFITRTKITECYDFTKKGTYQIFYHSYFPFTNGSLEIKSNVVTIVIE